MALKLTSVNIFIISVVCVGLVLFLLNAMSKTLFLVMALMIIVALLLGPKLKEVIDIHQAAEIANAFIKKLQKEHIIPQGTTNLEEAELKDIVMTTNTEPRIAPDRYLLKATVDPGYAYLIMISIYGSVIGYTKINVTNTYSLSNVKEREFTASLTRLDDMKDKKVTEDETHE